MKIAQRTALTAILTLAVSALHADTQYWNPNADSPRTAGGGVWDESVAAWAGAAAGTNTPQPWVNGNDANFHMNNNVANNAITVNDVAAGALFFQNSAFIFNPGSGPLLLSGPVTNNANTLQTFNSDIVLADDQNWFLSGQITVNGAITGDKALRRAGEHNLNLYNPGNAFSGIWAEMGAIYAYGGGDVLGGSDSVLKLGSPVQHRSSSFALYNLSGQSAEWHAKDLVANGYGDFGITRVPNNNSVTNIIRFSGSPLRENNGVIRINQYEGNGDGSAQIWFGDPAPGILGPDNLLPLWLYMNNEFLRISPDGWVKQAAYTTTFPWTNSAVLYNNTSTRTLAADADVYALRLASPLTIPAGFALNNASGEFVILNNILGDGDINLGDKEAIIFVSGTRRIEARINTTGGVTIFGGGTLSVPEVTWTGGTRVFNAYLQIDNEADVEWDLAVTGDIYGPPTFTGVDGGFTKAGAGKLTIKNANGSHMSRFTINSGDIEIKDSIFASTHNGVPLNRDGISFTVTSSIYRYGRNEFRTATGCNNISINVYGSGDPALPTIVNGRGGDDDPIAYAANGFGVGIGYSGYGNSLVVDGKGITGGVVWTNMIWNTKGLTVGSGAGASNNVARIINGAEFWDEITTDNAGNHVGIGIDANNNRIEVIGGDGFVSKLVRSRPNNIGNGARTTGNSIVVDGMGFPGSAVLQIPTANSLTVGNNEAVGNSLIVRDGGAITKGSLTVGRGSNDNYAEITGEGATWIADGGNSTFEVGVPYSTYASGVLTAKFNARNNQVYIADGARVSNFSKWSTTIGGFGPELDGYVNLGNSSDNRVWVGSNGYWNVQNAMHIGRVYGAGNTASNNTILVSGLNATLTAAHIFIGTELGNTTYGYSQAVGNKLIVEDGGYLYSTHISLGNRTTASAEGDSYNNRVIVRDNGHLYIYDQLRLGASNNFDPHDNDIEVTSGGMLTAHSIRLNSPNNNIVRIFNGGVWQLRTRLPTFDSRADVSRYPGFFTLENAVLSITNNTSVLIRDNWNQSNFTNVTWLGNNAFRMNDITLANSAANSYLFEPNISPTNYYRLEMVNGETRYRTPTSDTGSLTIGSAIGSGASMLCSNTTAYVDLPFVMNGELAIVNSTLTVSKPATIAGAVTLSNGSIHFEAGADISGEIIIDMDAADSGNLPSITGALTLGNGFIIRTTGEIIDGKKIAFIDPSASGSVTFDKSNLPPNYNYRYGVKGEGIASVHYYDPTTIIFIK